MDKSPDTDMTKNEPENDGSNTEIENQSTYKDGIEQLREEKSTRGLFAGHLMDKIKNSEDLKEKELLLLALKYGLDSFSNREVVKRWL